MTEADILSPAQVKRWLLSCYRPMRWDDLEEVGHAFKEIDLCLRQMDFKEMEGRLEVRFYANRITTDFHAELYRIVSRHGGQLVDYRVEVENNVRRLQLDLINTMEYRGPQQIEVVAYIIPPNARPRSRFHQALAVEAAQFARVFGHAHHPVFIGHRNQGGVDPDGDY